MLISMANNKVSSLLNKDLPRPPRSNFNLGRVRRTTLSPGLVVPVYCEEILPNSYKRLDLEALVHTNATIAPLMGSFTVKFEAFFVPLRLYHRHLDLNNLNPNFHTDFDFHYITIPNVDYEQTYSLPIQQAIANTPDHQTDNVVYTNYQVAPGSLIDHLRMLPVGFSSALWSMGDRPASWRESRVNAEPLIGYFDIWRNYYANPHDRRVPYKVQNSTADPVSAGIGKYSGSYRYFNLDDLDEFITAINTYSIDEENGFMPSAEDVQLAFGRYVQDDSVPENPSNVSFLSRVSIPLFSGQAIQTNPSTLVGVLPQYFDTRDGLHFGLLPRTFKDDYFNSRFLNEFVSYLQEQAVITVNDNKFNITQLRVANRIAKYIDKSIFSDTRFGSWIKAHFGVKTNSKLNIPQFLGSMTGNVVFTDIYATAQTSTKGTVTSNQALGSRASLGQGYVKGKGSFVEFNATEPGYLMVMCSLVPNVNYTQGIPKMYLKTSFNDLFRPEWDAIGYQPLELLEMDAVRSYVSPYLATDRDVTGNGANVFNPYLDKVSSMVDYNVAVGQQPAWLEYMTAVDESTGLMTQRYQFGAWVLNRPFNPAAYSMQEGNSGAEYTAKTGGTKYLLGQYGITDDHYLSTYILPDYFNSVFSVDQFTDNFQLQVRFYDKTKQPMSKQVLPSL